MTITTAALLQPESQLADPQAQAQQVLDEIDDAARLASEAMAVSASGAAAGEPAGLTTGEAASQDQADAGGEQGRAERNAERVKMFMARAARQRNHGREEMERVYTGVMVLEREVTIFDPHISSSVVRFLALTDKTIYLLGRVGSQYLKEAEVQKLREQIQERIEEYATEARQAVAAAAALSQKGRAESFMWLEPRYMAPALDHTFQIKSRFVLALAEAAVNWDEAIRLMCEMEFNGAVSESQISEMRLRERRLFAGINRFCAGIIMGMRRRTLVPTASGADAAEAAVSETSAAAAA